MCRSDDGTDPSRVSGRASQGRSGSSRHEERHSPCSDRGVSSVKTVTREKHPGTWEMQASPKVWRSKITPMQNTSPGKRTVFRCWAQIWQGKTSNNKAVLDRAGGRAWGAVEGPFLTGMLDQSSREGEHGEYQCWEAV
jgi:hypothetical protein